MSSIKVMLADDQTIMRDGLKTILSLDNEIEVVGCAKNGKEAVDLALELKPQIILMDIRMPLMDGVEATKIIKEKCKEIIIIVLTTFDDDEYIINALSYGAAGYLLKDIDGEKLIQAIHDGINGNIIMPGRVAAKLAARITSGDKMDEQNEQLSMFSDRELDVIRLIVEGKSNKVIAKELFLTEGTVKNYISTIYSRINVNDRANAILYFKNAGL